MSPHFSASYPLLDRLPRSLRDASDIVDDLTAKGVKLNIGGSGHDPLDPVGRLLVDVLAMVAEFGSDLIRSRTREGMLFNVGRATVYRTVRRQEAASGPEYGH